MSGFKKFILKGNLVDLAVAVIIGAAFGKVVSAFTDLLMAYISKAGGAKEIGKMMVAGADVSPFINSIIAFVILAAVVYFLVIVPYTKARERFFPTEDEPGGPTEVDLLIEIRDALANRA